MIKQVLEYQEQKKYSEGISLNQINYQVDILGKQYLEMIEAYGKI